jgi:hypothetical protein
LFRLDEASTARLSITYIRPFGGQRRGAKIKNGVKKLLTEDPDEIAEIGNKTGEKKLAHDASPSQALIGQDSPKLKKIKCL